MWVTCRLNAYDWPLKWGAALWDWAFKPMESDANYKWLVSELSWVVGHPLVSGEYENWLLVWESPTYLLSEVLWAKRVHLLVIETPELARTCPLSAFFSLTTPTPRHFIQFHSFYIDICTDNSQIYVTNSSLFFSTLNCLVSFSMGITNRYLKTFMPQIELLIFSLKP